MISSSVHCAVNYDRAVKILQQGGIIGYPTEALWALGCDPWNPSAIATLLRIKKRSVEKGLILVAADISQIAPLLKSLPQSSIKKLTEKTEHPTTWLIPDPEQWTPYGIRGIHASVGVRISQHPTVRSLCQAFQKPLVSTSANYSNQPNITSTPKALDFFRDTVDYVVTGQLGPFTLPSRIIDILTNQRIR